MLDRVIPCLIFILEESSWEEICCLSVVIDGVEGVKGEAGMPGRFGYEGFPGL